MKIIKSEIFFISKFFETFSVLKAANLKKIKIIKRERYFFILKQFWKYLFILVTLLELRLASKAKKLFSTLKKSFKF